MPSYPPDDYLANIGRLVYMVQALEGLVVGDLHSHEWCVPAELNAHVLKTGTLGSIASRIEEAVPQVTDGSVRQFLKVGAANLRRAAAIRNDVLHAWPATIDSAGTQRLNRGSPGDVGAITDEWIADAVRQVEELNAEVHAVRVT